MPSAFFTLQTKLVLPGRSLKPVAITTKRQISDVHGCVRVREIIRRCYIEIKCNCVTYVHVHARVTRTSGTRATMSFALDVTLKQHYIITTCSIISASRYHPPEILLSPFNERSSECETKKCDTWKLTFAAARYASAINFPDFLLAPVSSGCT